MALGVYCECGQLLPIVEEQADSAIFCSCGRKVVVPLLEEFRNRPVLLSAATLERRVRRLIAEGELPLAGSCARCMEVNSAEVVLIELECERYTARAHGGERFLILPLFPHLFFIRWREKEWVEIRGRDTDVLAPLCLCGLCRRHFRDPPRSVCWAIAALVVALGGLVGWLDVAKGVGMTVVGLVVLTLGMRWAFWRRQRTLKSLLRQIPIYRQILDRYPRAVAVMPYETSASHSGRR